MALGTASIIWPPLSSGRSSKSSAGTVSVEEAVTGFRSVTVNW
jgi:hypothetical protein